MTMKSFTAAMAVALIAYPSHAFYMPGMKPHTFQKNEEVPMKVNAMTSIHTQLPKDYYRLPFCAPPGGPKMASENLGEFLTGNKIQSSPYVINMLKEKHCQIICQVTLGTVESKNLQKHIIHGYHNNWIIDNLPSASIIMMSESGTKEQHYSGGFPIGIVEESKRKEAFIFNHVNIVVDYHHVDPGEEGYRVVAFAVEPMSIDHTFAGDFKWDGASADGFLVPLTTCNKGKNGHTTKRILDKMQDVRAGSTIIYTYDVIWQSSEVNWAIRWNIYMSEDNMVPALVHWYSIINSILVTVFLSCLVVSILVRNLRKDIHNYNTIADMTDEEKEEEADLSGWKLIHADVFRPPTNHPMLFCVFMGTGLQLLITALLAILLSAVGFISPARRGSLMTALLVFYMLCGSFAGFLSSCFYKAFKLPQWKLCTFLTAVLFPGVTFGTFLLFNVVLAFFRSPGSVPFLDVLIVFVMWSCVSIPMVFLGSYFGYTRNAIDFPTVTTSIHREIPEQNFLRKPKFSIFMGGTVPFAAVFVELFFIMSSLWMDQYYYAFGFTLLVFLLLITTCSMVTVLLVYYQLCYENHEWWWFSFNTSGSVALYTFLYSIVWFKELEASKMVITYLLYFGYMFLISFGMFLMTGVVGSLASFWFVHKMFSSIKMD